MSLIFVSLLSFMLKETGTEDTMIFVILQIDPMRVEDDFIEKFVLHLRLSEKMISFTVGVSLLSDICVTCSSTMLRYLFCRLQNVYARSLYCPFCTALAIVHCTVHFDLALQKGRYHTFS